MAPSWKQEVLIIAFGSREIQKTLSATLKMVYAPRNTATLVYDGQTVSMAGGINELITLYIAPAAWWS